MNVQDAPYLFDDFTVGFANVGGGDDSFGGGTVKVGTPISDDTVTDLFRCGSVADVGNNRVKSDIWSDWLGSQCLEHGILCFQPVGAAEYTVTNVRLEQCPAIRVPQFGPNRAKRIVPLNQTNADSSKRVCSGLVPSMGRGHENDSSHIGFGLEKENSCQLSEQLRVGTNLVDRTGENRIP